MSTSEKPSERTTPNCPVRGRADLIRQASFWRVLADGTWIISHLDHWHDAATGEVHAGR